MNGESIGQRQVGNIQHFVFSVVKNDCSNRDDLVIGTVWLWFQASLDETTGERCSKSERHSFTNLKGYDMTIVKTEENLFVKDSLGRCKPQEKMVEQYEQNLSRTVWDRQSQRSRWGRSWLRVRSRERRNEIDHVDEGDQSLSREWRHRAKEKVRGEERGGEDRPVRIWWSRTWCWRCV